MGVPVVIAATVGTVAIAVIAVIVVIVVIVVIAVIVATVGVVVIAVMIAPRPYTGLARPYNYHYHLPNWAWCILLVRERMAQQGLYM